MNEKTTTVYICDLKISDRAKRYLTRVGITTLNDLLNYDINELFVLYGFSDGVLHEIREVIGHSDTILRDFAERACRIADLLPSVKDIPIEKMKFGTRSYNALKKAGIHTVGSLIQLSQNDIFEMRNVGQQTRDNIISAINSVLDNGLTLFDKNESDRVVSAFEEDKRQQEGKGFDFAVIDILTKRFSLKAAKLAEWFELSRQSVYNAIEKQSPSRASKWTGKTLSEREIDILMNLISNKSFDYKDDKMTCCCMNNMQDDFVCLFIYDNEIKCFFLKDLPENIRQDIIVKKMHIYTRRELSGESSGKIVYVLTKPSFRPDDPIKFRSNAMSRGMTVYEYSVFISGYPYLDQRSVTDEQIIAFMQKNMLDGKVYISSDPKNQWIRSIASRNGYSIKDFIELFGFESYSDNSAQTTAEVKNRHHKELSSYILYDNVVYIPTDSHIYKVLSTYTYGKGITLEDYISLLGFKRTTKRPDTASDMLERDMEVRQSSGSFEEQIFAKYPLIGSRILKPETVDKLNDSVRKYIDIVLRDPGIKLTLRHEMQIALAVINCAKSWDSGEANSFWQYISLQLGYRDVSGSVVRILQSSVENAMKGNGRLFLEDSKGRAFKSTVIIHALSTRRSWLALFDFLFDFYKNNLKWQVISDDPLIEVMIRAISKKLSGDNEGEEDLTVSSKVYSFQEGIRKLVIYRPQFTRKLFEKLIGKIHSLVNSDINKITSYEDLLCEEWFKEKIAAIANTKKTERKNRDIQREIAIDYSRINIKYRLKNETDVQIVIPDIRLKNEDFRKATLYLDCNESNVICKELSWYGNELGKTLNGICISVPCMPRSENGLNVQVRILCDDETIYDSGESLNRSVLVFYGEAEINAARIQREGYTLVMPGSARLDIDHAEVSEIEQFKNMDLKACFLQLEDGYVITVNGHLLAFDNERSTEIKVIAPSESALLPKVLLHNTEAELAFRDSECSIILGSDEYLQRFMLLKNGEKTEFNSLQEYNGGIAFSLPLKDEKDTMRLQIIDLTDERLVYDKTFMLVEKGDCSFNRAFYYSADDYKDAEYRVSIDGIDEVIPFNDGDAEISMPFREGQLHADIPKIEVRETSGAWLNELRPAWYIGDIPQTSFFKVSNSVKANIRFLVGGRDIMYDGGGTVTIGNVLHSFIGTDEFTVADIDMQVSCGTQNAVYNIAKVYYKERFLKSPEFRFDDNKLFWDRGGAFIGKLGREFRLVLTGAGGIYEFKLSEDTEFIDIPADIPVGNYRYEISIQTGGMFRQIEEVVAVGDCAIGDNNLLRYMDRKIVIESITDENREEAGHITLRPCYIDHIRFCGVEETSEGSCPVYSGVMYTTGYHGERYEFSHDSHTNKKGVVKMMVNPVRIVYINDTALCITDADGDGLYYYSYYDRNVDSVVYALTDHEYTKANKHKYSNADLYSYRIERT